MKNILGLAVLTDVMLVGGAIALSLPARAESPLTVVYPPPEQRSLRINPKPKIPQITRLINLVG